MITGWISSDNEQNTEKQVQMEKYKKCSILKFFMIEIEQKKDKKRGCNKNICVFLFFSLFFFYIFISYFFIFIPYLYFFFYSLFFYFFFILFFSYMNLIYKQLLDKTWMTNKHQKRTRKCRSNGRRQKKGKGKHYIMDNLHC